jgi:DNA-binding transcriptional LysR family regulator
MGEMDDSTLRARKICETTQRLIASPAYLKAHGRPQRIDDLNEHRLLYYSHNAASSVWRITAPSGEVRQVRSASWFSVNDGQSLLNAAINGLGIAYLPSFLYAPALKQGLVEDVIPDLPRDVQSLYAVYPAGRFTQPKVRALIDFLVATFGQRTAETW